MRESIFILSILFIIGIYFSSSENIESEFEKALKDARNQIKSTSKYTKYIMKESGNRDNFDYTHISELYFTETEFKEIGAVMLSGTVAIDEDIVEFLDHIIEAKIAQEGTYSIQESSVAHFQNESGLPVSAPEGFTKIYTQNYTKSKEWIHGNIRWASHPIGTEYDLVKEVNNELHFLSIDKISTNVFRILTNTIPSVYARV